MTKAWNRVRKMTIREWIILSRLRRDSGRHGSSARWRRFGKRKGNEREEAVRPHEVVSAFNRQRTPTDWATGKRKAFWIPPNGYKTDWMEDFQANLYVSGSGDAAALRSLERRGLTEPQKLVAYAYAITEDGHKAAEDLRADADEMERLSKYLES
jgi:hypothetical protein